MSKLSFDGFGINGPDKYRSRIATFTNDEAGKAYGKLFEASPELLGACIHALAKLECAAEKAEPGSQMAHWFAGEDHGLKSTLRSAIAKAKGGAL